MGTQQILLIVLSVIIVGAAIAVGIEMFNAQDFTSNRAAASADVQLFLTQVLQYYKMPRSLGGLGGKLNGSSVGASDVAMYIGWGTVLPMENDNAHYMITLPENAGGQEYIDMKAIGSAVQKQKRAVVHGRIFFPEGKIEAKVGQITDPQSGIDANSFNSIDLWEGTSTSASSPSNLNFLGGE